jgi:hypothetical protein
MSDPQIPEKYDNLRRSTRVPIQVGIEIEGSGTLRQGETVIVNLQGALIKTSDLKLGDKITVHVSLTGKSAAAKVVFADPAHPQHFGIELERPENIWGIVLPPDDWETSPTGVDPADR